MINEAKAWQVKKVQNALYGKNNLVHTWGILTAENPMGNRYPSSMNHDVMVQLRQAVKSLGLEYIPVKGMYGSRENSLFVINISLTEMMKLSSRFDQESFIYAICRDGYSDATYYEKKAGKNSPYVPKYSRDRIEDMSDADDFFTSVKSHSRRAFKFQIPFFDGNPSGVNDDVLADVHENLNFVLNQYLVERFGYQGVERMSDLIEQSFSKNISERRKHSIRAEVYESRENRIKRFEGNIASLKRAMEFENNEEGKENLIRMVENLQDQLHDLISD